MLVLFVGFSGVGKDTVMKNVMSAYPDKFIKFPTYTTREKRGDESEGNPYNFITVEEFLKKVEAGELYEYNYIHNAAYYGGSKKVLSEYLATGKTLIKDIDVEGVRTYRERLSSTTDIISIYLYCEDEETVIARLRGRGETEDNINKRRKRFALENELSSESDYMINNISLQMTVSLVKAIIDSENGHIPFLPEVMPAEDEIASAAGETAPVILTPSPSGLIVTEGAARYVSALRAKRFIQKKIVAYEVQEGLAPACSAAEFASLIG